MVYLKASVPLKLCIASVLLLQLNFSETKAGRVVILPPRVTPVCSGDLLELTCSTSGSFLEWSFFLVPEGETTARRYSRVLHTESIPATSELTVNSITFTFSRMSAESSEPLTSVLLIDPVTDYLNGTEVNCTDVYTSNSTSTHIQVINESILIGEYQLQNFDVTILSEQFEREGVTVTFKLTELVSLYSYHVSAIPQLISHMFFGHTMVQLNMFYNVHYNVSVVAASPCGKNNVTIFTGIYHASCGNPANQIASSMVNIIGYKDPAIEGSNVTFSCKSGHVWNGSNTAICMRNGEWEPDPSEMECKTNCGPPPSLPNSYIIPYSSTIEGVEVSYVCWTAHQTPVCKQTIVTAVCTDEGNWETNSYNVCGVSPGTNGLSINEKIVVASVTTFVVTSILFIFIGFLCGHFYHRQNIRSTDPSTTVTVDTLQDDLEPRQNTEELQLEANVAYGSVSRQGLN